MRFRKIQMKPKAREYYHQYMSAADLAKFIELAERTFHNALKSDTVTPFFEVKFNGTFKCRSIDFSYEKDHAN